MSGWAVEMTLANMERRVLLSCEERALPAYLPRFADIRGRERLLFPGYVFVKCPDDREHELFRLRGGYKPIVFDGIVAKMAPTLIEQLRAREMKNGLIGFDERFEINQALQVNSGAYKNTVVFYRGMDAQARETAMFSLLGRDVVKAFDRNELSALDAI